MAIVNFKVDIIMSESDKKLYEEFIREQIAAKIDELDKRKDWLTVVYIDYGEVVEWL